jgi:hypothetical protein
VRSASSTESSAPIVTALLDRVPFYVNLLNPAADRLVVNFLLETEHPNDCYPHAHSALVASETASQPDIRAALTTKYDLDQTLYKTSTQGWAQEETPYRDEALTQGLRKLELGMRIAFRVAVARACSMVLPPLVSARYPSGSVHLSL